MARFKITYRANGEAGERIVNAADKEAALALLSADSYLAYAQLEDVQVKKLAELVSDNDKPRGRSKAAGVAKGGVARLELATRSGRIVWPPKGGKHEGINPGQWRKDGTKDETGCLPHDCPVKPLGYDGESYFLIDTLGQVFNTGTGAWGVERMQKLFAGQEDFLSWAWPKFGKGGGEDGPKVTGFAAEDARRDLFAACAKKGPWSMTDLVRGRGAWTDSQGRLILHCGEALYVDGELRATGEIDGYFYPRRPAIASPWAEPVEDVADNPAVSLVKWLRTWNFVRGDIDVMFVLGWIGVAIMGSALEWRPSIFTVGDAGTGKSGLLALFKAIFDRMLVSTTNATEAGLYQLLGHDSLPIAIDELEGEDGQAQAQKIIKMARDAATGSVRIRGGADHKGVEFAARSAFSFSAINPPPLPPASLTRLALLQLRPLKKDAGEPPVVTAAETIVPKLMRRIVDHWGTFGDTLKAFRAVLYEHGQHDRRGQDTYGTLLAAAYTLLGEEGCEAVGLAGMEKLEHYGVMLRQDAMPELEGKQPNWQRCIEAILTARPDAWKSGERHTVAQMLARLDRGDDAPFVEQELTAADVGLLKPGTIGEGYALAIPISSKALGKLLQDTSFGSPNGDGNWSFALSQAPDGIVFKRIPAARGEGTTNRASVASVQRRCVFLSLGALKKWQEENQ